MRKSQAYVEERKEGRFLYRHTYCNQWCRQNIEYAKVYLRVRIETTFYAFLARSGYNDSVTTTLKMEVENCSETLVMNSNSTRR